jgi:outer membrane protein OmpA-like peptidoglycan-associated protein
MFSEDKTTKKIFGSDSTMGLFVALYLILLAFFIVLTSVSNHAAGRASAAMDSVNDTFKRDGRAEQLNLDPRAQVDSASDPLLQSVQRKFFSELELEGRFSDAGGGAFEVRFPERFLFQPGSFRVRPDMNPFLNQLLDAFADANQSENYEIAFMFGSGAGPVAREPTRPQEIAIRRAGSLARYLLAGGLRAGQFSTGFGGIPEGGVLVGFNRRPAQGRFSRPETKRGGIDAG